MDNFELQGADEVLELLKELPAKTQGEILKATMRKVASETVVRPLRSALPYSSQTESHIRVYPDKDPLTIWAGPGSKSFYLRFVELGTKERTTKSGKSLGSISASNRIPTLMDPFAQDFVKKFNEEFGNYVNSIIEKKLKKIKK